MSNFRTWYPLFMFALFLCSSCWLVDTMIGTEAEPGGVLGAVGSAGETAEEFGIPWAGLAAPVTGILTSIIGFFAGRKGKIDAKSTINLIGELKKDVKTITNEEEFNKAITEYAKKNPKYGRILAKIHKKVRGKA